MAYTAWSVSFGEQPSAAKWNILGTNDASFNDGTGIGASAITPEKLLTGTGTTWPWLSYSPTLTNVTVGNGTKEAYYKQIGKTIVAKGKFTLGSTSSIGGTVAIAHPVTITATGYPSEGHIGIGTITDAGVKIFPARLYYSSTTTFNMVVFNKSNGANNYVQSNGGSDLLNASVPFALGNGDAFGWAYIAEAA